MKFERKDIPISEVLSGYEDNGENGVVAYEGRLTVRPSYQREFVYNDNQRKAVINSIINNWPLNTIHWFDKGYEQLEILDGQQRTISIGQYLNGVFSVNGKFFHNLTASAQKQILDYKLEVKICSGTDKEKLEYFKIINIAGEKLTDQELRNAVYPGPWLEHAKHLFSRPNCAAHNIINDGGCVLRGSAIRQDYLKTAIQWINDGHIEQYMGIHQHDENADELWTYFKEVIEWVRHLFPNYRREMSVVKWGFLFNSYRHCKHDADELESSIQALMMDDSVTKKSGIYPYLLTGDERHLSIRSFSSGMKTEAYERQKGICPSCGEQFDIKEMEADHITPWHEGGKTLSDNCQMLCKRCNRLKGGK